ncbi:MAG TPA: class I SAM-dependent methyltransferase [Thermomicrobiales bacterium]|nr:class I SAM-dependent methyltransferase [Thermomicrobiales bacterium]
MAGEPDAGRQGSDLNREAQEIWDAKAEFWDERMGEGNAFHLRLNSPSAERLLPLQPGDTVLDIACGNGQFSRRMAQLGATVVATDFSRRFLELARARTTEHADRVEYRHVDATDESQLLALGEGRFDAAVCLMALMDMADIEPLLRTLPRLLRPAGRFVFVIPHPCFNSNATRLSLEEEDRGGELIATYAVKITGYMTIPPGKAMGMPGEPLPHYYFDRPLSEVFNACFRNGFVLNGIEEPTFDDSVASARPLSWFSFKDIPPVLAARVVRGEQSTHGNTLTRMRAAEPVHEDELGS